MSEKERLRAALSEACLVIEGVKARPRDTREATELATKLRKQGGL